MVRSKLINLSTLIYFFIILIGKKHCVGPARIREAPGRGGEGREK